MAFWSIAGVASGVTAVLLGSFLLMVLEVRVIVLEMATGGLVTLEGEGEPAAEGSG